jgi:hypothetical protein
MNLVWQIATLKVVEMTQLIANSIFLIFNLSQCQVLCSFEYFNIETCSELAAFHSMQSVVQVQRQFVLRQLLFCQICSLSCSLFFILLEMIAINAFTRSTNLFSNEQSMF